MTGPELTAALEANINAQLRLMFAHVPGVEVLDGPDLCCLLSERPPPLSSTVYWAAFPPDTADARVAAVLARHRAQSRRPLTWVVTPNSRPADLGRRLEAHNLTHFFRGRGMAAETDWLAQDRPPAGLAIEPVQSVADLPDWLHPVAISFDLPPEVTQAFFTLFAGRGFGAGVPWRLLVGRVAGRPVAAAQLLIAAGVAGIYHVATVPEARRRGYGSALTLAAARAGAELGCRVAVLQASTDGYGVYQRLGFREVAQADLYRSTAG